MKWLKGSFIVICIATCFSTFVHAEKIVDDVALNSVNIKVNGQAINDTNIVYKDSTYVPLRLIFETIGCKVEWNEETKTASIIGKVKSSGVLTKTYPSYEDEYEDIKQSYDVIIGAQKAKGAVEEVTRLEKEFTEKAQVIKAKWDEINAKRNIPLSTQKQEIELDAITIVVNDNQINDTNILFNNRTFIPLRAISEYIGCDVEWDELNRTASIYGKYVPDTKILIEDYETLKAKYDKRIAEEKANGDKIWKETYDQYIIATGLNDDETKKKASIAADNAKHVSDIEVESLQKEFEEKAAKLKTNIIENN